MLTTEYSTERVCRCVCTFCAATGPAARWEVGAKTLAVLCGWNPKNGRCPLCATIATSRKAKSVKKK